MATAFAVHTDTDYRRALALVDSLWDAAPGSPEAELLDVMSTLIEGYEKRSRTLPPADPPGLIVFKLRELGWSQRELARRMGWGAGRVSEVLSGQRALTLRMVQDLSAALGLPPGSLVPGPGPEEPDHVWVQISRAHAERAVQALNPPGGLKALVEELLVQQLSSASRPAPMSTARTDTRAARPAARVGPLVRVAA